MNRLPLIRTAWTRSQAADTGRLNHCEWLVTNGLGGYGSGTISGIATRRYHGLLVAALPSPLGRMMMFNHLFEHLELPDGRLTLLSGGGSDPVDDVASIATNLSRFGLDRGLPVWRHEIGPYVIERRLFMPHNANTVHVTYQLLEGSDDVRLRLRPGMHFRAHEASVGRPAEADYTAHLAGNRMEVHSVDQLRLNLLLRGGTDSRSVNDPHSYDVEYSLENERGYAHCDTLWSPGHFETTLNTNQLVALSASTESWEQLLAIQPAEALSVEFERRGRLLDRADPRAQSGLPAELVLAADQFIINPTTRVADEARAKAAGDDVRSVIAGYHWFTDWGRDTMISLEGLTLSTGRWVEAGCTLRTFAHHVRDGLIPNFFLEGKQVGLYHTADATLWFFHALDRYLAYSNDHDTLRQLLPTLQQIAEFHLRGTQFGIGVDPDDGLLRQGEEGYQLTWMDAKVGDWVVTPRQGKPVEINALWFNALRLLAEWLSEDGQLSEAATMNKHADRAGQAFNSRFWCQERGWLFDVIDGPTGDDPQLRPNQIIALALSHPVLAENRWSAVLDVVHEQLLTPFGLRSLGPHETNYKSRYNGDLRSRDAAYHQGTVWAWLIGPFIDAHLRVRPNDLDTAHQFLAAFDEHLSEAGVGSISEIFDAERPFAPRGCIAQAWSVAEVLRTWIKTAPPQAV